MLEKILSPLRYFSGSYDRQWRARATNIPITAVLCYHRILPDETATDRLFDIEAGTNASTFEAHMRFMADRFEAIAPSRVLSPSATNLRFAVTFDDGYEDNFNVAAPILKRLNIPAAFYVVNEFIEHDRPFWWEQLAETVRNTHKQSCRISPQLAALMSIEEIDIALESWEQKTAVFEQFSGFLRRAAPADVDRTIALLAELLDCELPDHGRRYPLMTWKQLRHLAADGFEIGSHTASHLCLDGADARTRVAEIDRAVTILEQSMESPVATFAYPYGHLDDAAVESVRNSGVALAFGGSAGLIASPTHDPFQLPRLHLTRKQNFACAYRMQKAFDAVG